MSQIASTAETERTVHNDPGPWHHQVQGLNVIKVKGSFYEMGYQHGSMLREQVREGALPYYRTYMERMLGRGAAAPVAPLVWPLVQRLIGRKVENAIPGFGKDMIRGLAEGAQIPLAEVMAGATMPDSLLWVASRLMRVKRIGPAMHHRMALGLGCTSAMAWGKATSDGQLLHARNLDYHGVACWPRTATVSFCEPDDGQAYVAVGAAGAVMGGVTSMNAAGLTLTVHQHMFTDRTELGGTPIGLVGDIVMRHARSLDDAEAILRDYRPIGCWTYLIADGHQKEVLCWEENPERQAAIRINGDTNTFGYTNIYLDRELGNTERALYGSYWRHNLGRYGRAKQLLEEGSAKLKPQSMAQILGDTGASDCRIQRSIAMLMTVGSVVFRPRDGAFWVATGEAPTSRNNYVPFSLSSEAHAPEFGELNGASDGTEAEREAFAFYRKAYLAAFDDDDLPRARQWMERALLQQPEQALYQFIGGLLALKDADLGRAREAFDAAIRIGHPDVERRAAFHLWRARGADLSGEREEALRDYRATLGYHADPPVHRAARQGLARPYRRRSALHFQIDFAFADVMSP